MIDRPDREWYSRWNTGKGTKVYFGVIPGKKRRALRRICVTASSAITYAKLVEERCRRITLAAQGLQDV